MGKVALTSEQRTPREEFWAHASPPRMRNFGIDGSIGKYHVRRFPLLSNTSPLIFFAGGIPYFLYRSALTRELYDFIVELRPSTTSGKLADNIKRV
jgi:hypothetical protein